MSLFLLKECLGLEFLGQEWYTWWFGYDPLYVRLCGFSFQVWLLHSGPLLLSFSPPMFLILLPSLIQGSIYMLLQVVSMRFRGERWCRPQLNSFAKFLLQYPLRTSYICFISYHDFSTVKVYCNDMHVVFRLHLTWSVFTTTLSPLIGEY